MTETALYNLVCGFIAGFICAAIVFLTEPDHGDGE